MDPSKIPPKLEKAFLFCKHTTWFEGFLTRLMTPKHSGWSVFYIQHDFFFFFCLFPKPNELLGEIMTYLVKLAQELPVRVKNGETDEEIKVP